MKNLLSEISNLPSDQLDWLLTIKRIFKPTIQYGTMETSDLINAFKFKANEKDFINIVTLLNTYDFEEYFKN